MGFRAVSVVFLTLVSIPARTDPRKIDISAEIQTVLDTIQPSSLRKNLSYIASDELEGRDTPSRGLDLAADYIAEQFRVAGLEPGVGTSYFQEAPMLVEDPNFSDFEIQLQAGGRRFDAVPKDARLRVSAQLDMTGEPLFKLDLADETLVKQLQPSQLEGRVVITRIEPRFRGRMREAGRALREGKPALLIVVDAKGLTTRGEPVHRLVDPSARQQNSAAARVTLTGDAAAHFYDSLPAGVTNAAATVHIAAPRETPVKLRNVIGVLRGSDPALRDQCVLLTAHYDHLGMKPTGAGDRIYNGANDDGSGTVSVLEGARALAHLAQHPRRSIVFMTFFGEEEGLIGSKYYAHHPVWPLAKTVADLNLEQLGRTDATDGRQVSDASLTGFDYSDLTNYVERAGESTGIRIYKNERASDVYFPDSDNFSLAEVGVPAQTLFVALDFPDYHAVGDEWQKIDFDNMAKVDRAITLAVFLMADSADRVHWNQGNSKTAPYVKAGAGLQ